MVRAITRRGLRSRHVWCELCAGADRFVVRVCRGVLLRCDCVLPVQRFDSLTHALHELCCVLVVVAFCRFCVLIVYLTHALAGSRFIMRSTIMVRAITRRGLRSRHVWCELCAGADRFVVRVCRGVLLRCDSVLPVQRFDILTHALHVLCCDCSCALGVAGCCCHSLALSDKQ